MGPDVVAALRQVVAPTCVIDDPELTAGYEVDWTGRFRGRARCLVRPTTSDEVVAIVRWCADNRVALVPQGGNTGLVGGGVPDGSGQAVLLSLRALNRIREVDTVAGQVTVEAGVTLGALEQTLLGTPWEFGVDLAARDTATLGGMAATNAGGLRVLRHGTMRANVLGVEAVLGNGDQVSHLAGLVKDNTGYDLGSLLCGSEGTLGVITGLRLRLVPRQPDRCVVWVACQDWEHALAIAVRARLEVDGLDGLEAVDDRSLELVQNELGLPNLFEHTPPVALLIAWAGRGLPPEALAQLVDSEHHVVGTDIAASRRLWAYRDRVTEAVALTGVPRKFDVTLPLGRLVEFSQRVTSLDGLAGAVIFGHLGDGNLHVNVPGAGADDAGHEIDDRVLRTVASCDGSISAEHGIGRHKAPWLGLSRSAHEVATFGAIKSALDPAGIMNPGVLLSGREDRALPTRV